MPSVSPAQARLMAGVAHSPEFAKKVGVPQSVGKDFNKADAGTGILSHPHKAFGGGIGHFSAMHAPKMPHGIGHMHFADGGAAIPDMHFPSGLIPGSGAGRTDRIPLAVPSDSHVLPADVVSGAGQGATQFGARALEAALATAPWGVPLPKKTSGRGAPSPPSGSGMIGHAEGGEPRHTSILAASGEIVVPAHDVEALGQRALTTGQGKRGESAMDAGHRILDEMIARIRKHVIEWTRTAPPPKK